MSRWRLPFEILTVAVAIGGAWFILAEQVERVPVGATRPFNVGLAYWPPQGAPDDLIKAGVGATLENSEVILVQVPWSPHGRSAAEMTSWMGGVAKSHGHGLVVALDWMEPSRDSLLGGGWSFEAAAARTSFASDLLAVATRLQPDRVVLGVEVDMLATRAPEEFDAFVTLYAEVYRQIRQASPSTEVGVSFQYEAMAAGGMLDVGISASGPVAAFGPLLDFTGISLYPCLRYASPEEIPADYLAALDTSNRPLAVMETGWPSPVDGSAAQADYLDWLVSQPQSSNMDLLVWISTADSSGYSPPDNGPACPSKVDAWHGGLGLWGPSVQPKTAAHHWTRLRRTRRISAGLAESATVDQIDPQQSPLY